tara:strand:+ start:1748 stop:1918 length:171 start_codon:yes stop_codon:yes gene_type:complete
MNRMTFMPILLIQLIACSAEVGSEQWCEHLDAKAKGDWTLNEAKDYAKHCLFKIKE